MRSGKACDRSPLLCDLARNSIATGEVACVMLPPRSGRRNSMPVPNMSVPVIVRAARSWSDRLLFSLDIGRRCVSTRSRMDHKWQRVLTRRATCSHILGRWVVSVSTMVAHR